MRRIDPEDLHLLGVERQLFEREYEPPLLRMTVEESFIPQSEIGLFLCISAVKAE